MKRIKKVQKALSGYGVDALLVQHPVDLLYLTGVALSAGTLIIGKEDVQLVVDGRYFEKCKKETSFDVALLANGLLARLVKPYKKIGFDGDATTYSNFQKLQEDLHKQLIALHKPIEHIRAVKEPSEIKAMQRAANLCMEGFTYICGRITKGITEKRLALELELFWLSRAADKLSFEPIIAFGKNSSMPHYRAQNIALRAHDAVLLDIGVVVDGYASDLTRTVFYGKPKPKMLEIYRIVKKAQEKAIAGCKAGLATDALYRLASNVIEKAGYKEAFLHGLGHGIGLDVHEYPIIRPSVTAPLQKGMVVTIEPGIYIPDLGGVRIEDMVLITQDGHKVLTVGPKEALILDVV